MLKKYLETGKIVGTHGVKGAVRVQPWCDSPDFLKQFKHFYTDASGSAQLDVVSAAPHGNVVLITFKGVDSIEKAEMLRNKIIYIARADANLPRDRYFIDDLIGCSVFDSNTDELLGTLCDVSKTGANDVWHIQREEKEYLMPAIDDVIVEVDVENSKVRIKPLKGIFDDED